MCGIFGLLNKNVNTNLIFNDNKIRMHLNKVLIEVLKTQNIYLLMIRQIWFSSFSY